MSLIISHPHQEHINVLWKTHNDPLMINYQKDPCSLYTHNLQMLSILITTKRPPISSPLLASLLKRASKHLSLCVSVCVWPCVAAVNWSGQSCQSISLVCECGDKGVSVSRLLIVRREANKTARMWPCTFVAFPTRYTSALASRQESFVMALCTKSSQQGVFDT